MGASGCSVFAGLATGNPVVDATTFEQAAVIADQIAVAAFNIAEPLLPASVQVQAQADFTKAQAVFQNSMAVLADAVKAYEDGTSQNWGALYGDVTAAVDQVVAIVMQFGSTQAGVSKIALMSPAFATRSVDLTRAVATLHRYH